MSPVISLVMKVVHLKKENSPESLLAEAARKEEQIIREHPTHGDAYSRLMTIYRKQKNYKKELQVINKAISTFEDLFKKKQPAFNNKVAALSKALRKATGLADSKGNNLYELGDLARWKKRKLLLQKKMKSPAKK